MEDPIKIAGSRVLIKVFPIITPWELSVAMETRLLNLSALKPNTGKPQHTDASDQVCL